MSSQKANKQQKQNVSLRQQAIAAITAPSTTQGLKMLKNKAFPQGNRHHIKAATAILYAAAMLWIPAASAHGIGGSPLSGKTIWQTLHKSLYLTTGPENPKRIIYVFFDPNCEYCHAFWDVSHKTQNELSLDIRWVPVAFLKGSSMAKAAAIMESNNSPDAFRYNEEHFHESTEEGGIRGVPTAPTGLMDAIKANWETLKIILRNDGTPTIVYPYNGTIHVQRGLPSSQSKIYQILTGR